MKYRTLTDLGSVTVRENDETIEIVRDRLVIFRTRYVAALESWLTFHKARKLRAE